MYFLTKTIMSLFLTVHTMRKRALSFNSQVGICPAAIRRLLALASKIQPMATARSENFAIDVIIGWSASILPLARSGLLKLAAPCFCP